MEIDDDEDFDLETPHSSKTQSLGNSGVTITPISHLNKVPFIDYVSTFIAKNLILLSKLSHNSLFFCDFFFNIWLNFHVPGNFLQVKKKKCSENSWKCWGSYKKCLRNIWMAPYYLGKTSEKRNFTRCWRQYSHAFFFEFRTDQENENDAYGCRVISVLCM